jgi:hypothetical protein
MPSTEPAPLGFASAYAAHPGPTRVAGSIEVLESEDISEEVIGAEVAALDEEESELSSEQPATRPIAKPTLATVTATR